MLVYSRMEWRRGGALHEPKHNTEESPSWKPFDEFLREDTRNVLDRTLLDAGELLAARPWLYRLADFFNFSAVCSFIGFVYCKTLIVPAEFAFALNALFQLITWWLRRRPVSAATIRREYAAVMFLHATAILAFTAISAEPIGTLVSLYNLIFVGLTLLSLTPRFALAMVAQTLLGLYAIRLVQDALGVSAHLAPHPIGMLAATGVGLLYVIAFFATLFLVSLVWRQKARNREAQRDLELANARLRAAERARAEFLSTVTHELRTPLVTIHGYVDILMRREGEDREALQVVKRSAGRLQRLIEDLLHAADPAHLAAHLRLEPLDPAELAREEIAGLAAQAARRRVVFELAAAPGCRIRADRLRFGQILSNLFENAVKHSPEGGVVRVTVLGGDWVTLTVDDEGPGIPAGQSAYVFEWFYRGGQTAGLGIGLAICRQLATAMGGTIAAGEGPGGGARFTLRFPAVAAAPAAVASHAKRALVLDDEPDVLTLMRATLSQYGYEVETVQNGTLALERGLAADYDLFLLDINVPGLTGVEVSRRLRAADRPGRVLLFSALIHADADRIVAEAQAHGFLPKPFNLDSLERILGASNPA